MSRGAWRRWGAAVAAALLLSCRAASPVESASPPTLRALYRIAAPTQLDAATTALVLVDFQEEFLHGRLPVEGAEEAVLRASALRRWARDHGLMVVHVKNVVTRPDSPIFAEGSPMTAIVPQLSPLPDEVVMIKHQAGAFSKTDLDSTLRARSIDTLIVAGIMTHLAVDTTARDGAVLGYRVIVAADACATRALPATDGGPRIEASELHRVALASLADRFADVFPAERILSLPVRPRR